MADKNENIIKDLEKALSDFFSEEEMEEILKAKKADEDEMEEEGEDVSEEEDEEKANYDKLKKAYDKKSKELDEMIAKMEGMKKGVKKSEDEDINKSEKEDLIKSITAKLAENDELKKSIEDLSEKLSSVENIVKAIGETPAGRRAMVSQSEVLEKGGTGSNGKEISIRDKKFIEKALSDMSEKDSKYENALLRLNAGGAMPNAEILKAIEIEKGISFVN